jgi:hypothetical protein
VPGLGHNERSGQGGPGRLWYQATRHPDIP